MERLWVPFRFALWVVAKSLCSCLCLFDAVFKLHAMGEKMSNDFLTTWGGRGRLSI